MLIVRSEGVLCRIDPRHGAEVVELVELRNGRQVLGRTPFATGAPLAGDLDEESWTRRYRGGWQFLAPNAGNAAVVDGVQHGFHGRASNDPWEVIEADDGEALLRWCGHGLTVERRYVAHGRRLDVRTAITADVPGAWTIAAEHISFGTELLDPVVEIDLPGGRVWEQSETTGPTAPPENAGDWPTARLLDGGDEDVHRLALSEPRGRFLALADVPPGPIVVRSPSADLAVRLDWDRGDYPFMWMWHENRASDWLWGRKTEILVIEAATVPHALGLAEAIASGHAVCLNPGEHREYAFSVEVE